MDNILDAIKKQQLEQIKTLEENNFKGDPFTYAKGFNDPGGVMIDHILGNVYKLQNLQIKKDWHGVKGPTLEEKQAAVNVLNYTLFYMINRGLL